MHEAGTARWTRCWTPRRSGAVRLICFPWAGGSAAAFRPMAQRLPGLEVWTVEYPGRGSREAEAALGDVGALAQGCAPELEEVLDEPFAVLGYSLGALVGYEWVRGLAARGHRPPRHFFACARRAPHLPPAVPFLHRLGDGELVAALGTRFDAVPDLLLGEPELLSRFLAPLRADLRAVETYAYAPGPRIACSLTAVGGGRDGEVSTDTLAAWSAHTEGPCAVEVLADAGHFFLGEPRLHALVVEALDRSA